MVKFSEAMASLMRKFKKKHVLSTDMHNRWGDPAISYPTEGSWNQWNQTSGFAANASMEPSRHVEPNESRRYAPSASVAPQHHKDWDDLGSQHIYTPPETTHDRNFPKGYFDENIRHRAERAPNPQMHGLGIEKPRHESRNNSIDSEMDMHSEYQCDEEDSCDEEDEERDTLGASRGLMYRGYTTGDIPRHVGREECGSYSDRPAPSPSLSVTSRMRRASTQSSTTQASSVSGGGSRRTSYTAASSVSAPSLPPDTPRFPTNAMNTLSSAHGEKRHVYRPKPREPERPNRQQMVPSYDELYG